MTDPHTRDVEELLRLKTEECERLRERVAILDKANSEAMGIAVHLSLSFSDIRDQDGFPCLGANREHRQEALQLAKQFLDDYENSLIREALNAERRDRRREARAALQGEG